MHGTLADFAALPGMPTEPTLRRWIDGDPDFPGIVRRGAKKGDPWTIDLPVAAAHIVALRDREEQERQRHQERLDQLGLDLGLSAPAKPGISIADRQALLEEEAVALKVGKLRGELIDKASVREAVAMLLVKVQQQGASLAARLARQVDLPRQSQNALDELIAGDLHALARELRLMGMEGGDGDGADLRSDSAAATMEPAAA